MIADGMLTFVIIKIIVAVLVFGGVLSFGGFLTWVERKQSALMQDRIGANRASIMGFRLWGLFHIMSDGLKMFAKEDFIPPTRYRLLFRLAPYISWSFALAAFAVVPFTDTLQLGGHEFALQVANPDIGILFVLAMLGMSVYGVILGGWTSNNNFALLGTMRGVAQLISYEVVLGLSLIGPLLVYQTLDLQEMVHWQGQHAWGWLPWWGIFFQPLAFLLFLTAGVAESKRLPFDLPESESEIIGFQLEYSSMRFGAFMFTDFVETILVGALATTIFLGGWQVPWLSGQAALSLDPLLVWALRAAAFAVKLAIVVYVLMLVRWTLPRFRYDQLMQLGWKIMLPLALANTIITGIVVYGLQLR